MTIMAKTVCAVFKPVINTASLNALIVNRLSVEYVSAYGKFYRSFHP
jgi:hypothetical protein